MITGDAGIPVFFALIIYVIVIAAIATDIYYLYKLYFKSKIVRRGYRDILEESKPILEKLILAEMAEAEFDWADIERAGEFKLAQVVAHLYERFPSLVEIAEQDEVLDFIADTIEKNLPKIQEKISSKL